MNDRSQRAVAVVGVGAILPDAPTAPAFRDNVWAKRYSIVELTGDIYYFTTKLPVKLELPDVLIIVTAALVICFLATLYPARQASKLDPVEAIRYE